MWGIRGNISVLSKSFNAKKLCSRLYLIELAFHSQKRQIRSLSHLLAGVGDYGFQIQTHRLACSGGTWDRPRKPCGPDVFRREVVLSLLG